ncbi:MAG: hypothetical protein ACK5RL_15380 [Acidimicrobiales bacterium]
MTTTPARPDIRNQIANLDSARWTVIGILAVAALLAIALARVVTGPIENLATRQVCADFGEPLDRQVEGYERTKRFTLLGWTGGECTFGPSTVEPATSADGSVEAEVDAPFDEATAAALAADPTQPLTVPLGDVPKGGLYRIIRLMSFVLQIGAASSAVRVLAEPVAERVTEPAERVS